MAPLARLPVFLALNERRAVIAGGSAAAAWKAELLAAAGAHVDVYAEHISDEMRSIAADIPHGAVVLHERPWSVADLSGAAIAIGACEDEGSAAAFARAARTAGIPVNVIDKPAYCDFAFGSIVNRSPLVIGISTDGAAPAFAQAVRSKIEALLPKGFAAWAAAAQSWRAALKKTGLGYSVRRKFWQLFAAHAVAHPQQQPSERDFAQLLAGANGDAPGPEMGSVALVGAGPGNAELLTLRAVRALQTADVILFDDLVSEDVLDFARREARKLMVGKTGFGPSCRQEDINALMVGLARQGQRVVRLKGGDPLIFGRAAEEIDACAGAGIPVEIVPGVSAAQGAAAELNIPLTGRGCVRRVQYVAGHAREGRLPDDLDWRALCDPSCTTAVYMPRQTLAALTARALDEGLDPMTPAIAVSRATRPEQRAIRAPVGELASRLVAADLPGPLLILIGKVIARGPQTDAGATFSATAAG